MKGILRAWVVLAFLSAVPAVAQTIDSFETGTANWVVGGNSSVTLVQTTQVGSVVPTDLTYMAKVTCPTCSGPMTVTYTLTSPMALPVNQYVAVDMFSVGTPLSPILISLNGGVIQSGSNNTSCGPGGNPDGVIDQTIWESVYVKITSAISLTTVSVVFPGPVGGGSPLYMDYLRVTPGQPSCVNPCFPAACTPTNTPVFVGDSCASAPGTPTCTPTNTFAADVCASAPLTPTCTPTPTPTFMPDVCAASQGTFTCTPTATPTNTGTPTVTTTFTPSATPTPTAWPITVYPNPIDFQQTDVDSSGKTIDFQCHGPNAHPIPSNLVGCIKINGIEHNTTLKIYTLSLSHVRTFLAESDADFNVLNNPNAGQIVWDGTNENRNPVAPGMYFYTYEGGAAGKVIGKFAIKRSRK